MSYHIPDPNTFHLDGDEFVTNNAHTALTVARQQADITCENVEIWTEKGRLVIVLFAPWTFPAHPAIVIPPGRERLCYDEVVTGLSFLASAQEPGATWTLGQLDDLHKMLIDSARFTRSAVADHDNLSNTDPPCLCDVRDPRSAS